MSPTPPFYRCGQEGVWDPQHGQPFRFPTCARKYIQGVPKSYPNFVYFFYQPLKMKVNYGGIGLDIHDLSFVTLLLRF